ncbi:MAG: NADH-quinone oxidoreductase subunit J [Desulfurococcales archaeon]|nr:NADH-quinone oxidoreductase subunit J [Desulfurococcales archaeon]
MVEDPSGLDGLRSIAVVGLSVSLLLSGYLVVRVRDLVYASLALAVLGLVNAMLIALLGFSIVAAFLVIVYVGAAVMFIIVSVSMLGGGGQEEWRPARGAAMAALFGAGLAVALAATGAYQAYSTPTPVSLREVSETILSRYGPAIGVLFVALAATLIEAIAVAKARR